MLPVSVGRFPAPHMTIVSVPGWMLPVEIEIDGVERTGPRRSSDGSGCRRPLPLRGLPTPRLTCPVGLTPTEQPKGAVPVACRICSFT